MPQSWTPALNPFNETAQYGGKNAYLIKLGATISGILNQLNETPRAELM